MRRLYLVIKVFKVFLEVCFNFVYKIKLKFVIKLLLNFEYNVIIIKI